MQPNDAPSVAVRVYRIGARAAQEERAGASCGRQEEQTCLSVRGKQRKE